MKDKFFLVLGILIVGWSFYAVLQQPAPAKYQPKANIAKEVSSTPLIRVGDKAINIEIADTDALRTQGLSGRSAIGADMGMLFIFDTPNKYGFWMKGMSFPLDIVWIDESWRVVGVEREVSPNTYPQIFSPEIPAKYVLEINSGDASRLGIDTGTQLSFEHGN